MLIPVLLLCSLQAPARKDTSAYLDRDAQVLVARARAARAELGREIVAYTATVKQRMGVALRMPLKDRTLFRSETAARVRWMRDEPTVIKLLAANQQHPGSEYNDYRVASNAFDEIYDPRQDRLYFGMTHAEDQDVWIDHPLIDGSEVNYRFRTGDTLTMSFVGSRPIKVVQLQVLPRVARPKLISGSMWIEPVSGAIVKAAFHTAARLNLMTDTDAFSNGDEEDLKHVPAIFKPFEIEVSLITIEYAYWHLKHWLPRAMRFEGMGIAGIVKAPAAMDISYDIHEVIDDSMPADSLLESRVLARRWRDEGDNMMVPRRRSDLPNYLIYPTETDSLTRSKDLPPPIWDSSSDFITEKELLKLYGGLAQLPGAPSPGARLELAYPPRHYDLLRYNRVEGLSGGVRGVAEYPRATLSGTARLGAADRVPNLTLSANQHTLKRNLTFTAAHELRAVDPASLNLGASANAFLFGRDDGEYYRATGLSLTHEPPAARARTRALTLFAERHRPVSQETAWSLAHALDGDQNFRPNILADSADLAGAQLLLRGWWGTDATGWQVGAELATEAATGDFRYARGALTVRTAFPLGTGARAALELAGGTATDQLPVQKRYYLGGASTLRGYAGSATVGATFLRTRAELARTFASNAFAVALFSDAGWAGARSEFALRRAADNALVSGGVGLSILDGLVRFDLARALRAPVGWRFEIHLDSVL